MSPRPMLISCPHCSSTYDIPSEVLAGRARVLRCAECRDCWTVDPSSDLPGDGGPNETVVPLFGPEIVTEARFTRRATPPRGPRLPPARARLAGSLRRARGAAALAGLSLGLAALMAGAAHKEAVVRALPGSGALFAAAGLPVNLRGLSLGGIEGTVADAAPGSPVLTLQGRIQNLRPESTAVPRLRFSLRDKASNEVYTWTAPAPKPRLAAGEAIVFRNRLAAPPQEGRDLVVSFADAVDTSRGMPEPR